MEPRGAVCLQGETHEPSIMTEFTRNGEFAQRETFVVSCPLTCKSPMQTLSKSMERLYTYKEQTFPTSSTLTIRGNLSVTISVEERKKLSTMISRRLTEDGIPI